MKIQTLSTKFQQTPLWLCQVPHHLPKSWCTAIWTLRENHWKFKINFRLWFGFASTWRHVLQGSILSVCIIHCLDPCKWGWMKEPVFTSKPPIPEKLAEMISCICKSGCGMAYYITRPRMLQKPAKSNRPDFRNILRALYSDLSVL